MTKDIRVFLYTEYPSPSLDINLIIESLRKYGFFVENRGDILDYLCLSEPSVYNLARRFSEARIPDVSRLVDSSNKDNQSQIDSELNKILGLENIRGNFYDGYWIQRTLYRLLVDKLGLNLDDGDVHIIFTGRLFGTFEDRRYHARVLLMGTPSLISTSGLIEAPAKPREYYYVRGRMIQSGMDISELDNIYKGRFVDYDDPKITSILKSYALQVIFYELTGNAFCDNATCCLSNSHWQEEVLKVQYQGKLCDKCNDILS
jgi:hypothetical protein